VKKIYLAWDRWTTDSMGCPTCNITDKLIFHYHIHPNIIYHHFLLLIYSMETKNGIELTLRFTHRNKHRNKTTNLKLAPKWNGKNWLCTGSKNPVLTQYGHIKTAEQQTIIQQYSDLYTNRWWVSCYIWYSEEGPGWAVSLPSPLLAVLNVLAKVVRWLKTQKTTVTADFGL